MQPAAEVLLDSISPNRDRVTTMKVTMHRFVLAEFNTHRMFSRNSASSRAIPVSKRLQEFANSPAWPISWPAEQPGMQGGSELTGLDLEDAQRLLRRIHHEIEFQVTDYIARHPQGAHRLHKSVINRMLEPFLWHTVIVTSSEWENFFEQRCSPLAQPEIMVAARLMEEALSRSEPEELNYNEWHIPMLALEERVTLPVEEQLAIGTARCARVSYLTHDGKRDLVEDVGLYERLTSQRPPHWSPLEHCVTPDPTYNAPGNTPGFRQLRHDVGMRTRIATWLEATKIAEATS